MPVLSLVVLVVALGAALVYGAAHAGIDAASARASTVKTLSTAGLALAGLVAGAPGWVVTGLALGAVGDFALSRPSDRAFLLGMLAFALGHGAYGLAFAAQAALPLPGAVGPVAALMAAMVAGTAVWIAPRAGALCWPVRTYALVIAAMAITAAALPAGFGLVRVGVAAFVASDLILAVRLFILREPRIRLIAARLLWPLYWGGQALILIGFLP